MGHVAKFIWLVPLHCERSSPQHESGFHEDFPAYSFPTGYNYSCCSDHDHASSQRDRSWESGQLLLASPSTKHRTKDGSTYEL